MKVLGFLDTRIGRRFLAVFLAVSLLPLVVMGWFAMRNSETALRQQTLSVLRAAADGAEAQLREFLKHLQEQTIDLAADQNICKLLESADAPVSSDHASLALPELSNLLARKQAIASDIEEIFVLTPQGRVVASSAPDRAGADASLTEYFRLGQKSFFAGDVLQEPDTGKATWIMTAPVKDLSSGSLIGVVACRVDPRTLSDLTTGRRILANGADTQSFRIGNTGETYVVNRKGLMITESRDIPNSALRVKVDTLPVRMGLERGQEITSEYRDYRGIEVSGASALLRDLGWVLVTEIDFRQAFAPLKRFQKGLLELTVGLGLLLVFLAWSSTQRIIGPIQLLDRSDRALSKGDETGAIASEKGLPHDELGELVRRRNERVKAHSRALVALEERTAKLREAAAELEHMSYSIVHDMRAPLRAITSFSEMILDEDSERLSQQSREYLARVKTAALRMDHLIRDVLSYSFIVRGDLPLSPVNTSELLRGVIETYPRFQNANIAISPELPDVQGNEALLTQCFSNLLDNAVKFVQPGRQPEIRVTAERVGGRVRILIRDNGVGIPKPLHERIFGIFERGGGSEESTGIGLAIVRKAVERMRGRVGVVSEPGQGSEFWIELHAADPERVDGGQ